MMIVLLAGITTFVHLYFRDTTEVFVAAHDYYILIHIHSKMCKVRIVHP